MNGSFRSRLLRALIAVASVAAILLAPELALAQSNPGQQGPQTHSDAIPYLLVLFCIVLGLIVACGSSGRTSEVRLEELSKD